MKNPSMLEAFKKLRESRCRNELGSKIIQGLQRQMHRERFKVAKCRGGKNGS